MVAMDLGSPLLPKKSLPVSGALEQVASRLSSKVAAEVPHGSKQELPDLKGEWPKQQGMFAGQHSHAHRSTFWPGQLPWVPRLALIFLPALYKAPRR